MERIEAENRRALKAHFAKLAKNCLYQRNTPPTNVLGGYKFPARRRPPISVWSSRRPSPPRRRASDPR